MAAYVGLFTLVSVPSSALLFSVVTRAAGGTVGTGDCAVTVSQTSTVEVTSANGKCIYKFTSGTNSFTPPVTNSRINFLLVGGGGGGGSNRGGGGGAGGFYESSWTYTAGVINVSVGAGGAGGGVPTSNVGVVGGNGGNSSISGGTAIFMAGGGGGGGAHSPAGSDQNGVAGRTVQNGWTGPSGSGGGASMNFQTNTWTGGSGYSGSDGYGTAGGGSGTLAEPTRNTGGGGGAGGAGIAGSGGNCSASAGTTPDGGLGRTSSITGTLVAYAGGGGGADSRGATETCSGPDTARNTAGNGAGGAGGGGAGATLNGTAGNGVANVGGGGGGGNSDSTPGGDGGSGVVILAIDLSKPVSSGSTTIEYLPKASNTVSVAYTATDANSVASVAVYFSTLGNLQYPTQCGTVTGLSGTSVSGNITCTVATAPTINYTYYIYTRATDASGLTEDAPTVADDQLEHDAFTPLSTPTITPTAINTSTVSVAYTATDNTNLASVTAYVTTNSGYTGGSSCGTATVSGTSVSGTISCTLSSPTNGTTYYFYTVATDAAGQTEATANQTDGDSVKYDTTKPVLSNGPGPTSVKSSASFSITSSETGTLYIVSNSITVTNVASITSANDNQFNSVASAGAGVATSVAATGLAEGTYNVYAADDAGNLSTVYTFTIKVDDTAPATPTALAMLLASDAGLSYTDGITNVASPFIEYSVSEREGSVTLTAVKGASTVTCSAGLIAGGTSKPFCQLASLTDGTWTVTAVQTDSAGNASPTSSSYSFIIDTVASAAPTGVDLLTDWDYGPGSTDNVTNASYPRFTATKPETTGRIDLKMVQSAVTAYTCSFVETDVDQFCALEPTNGNTTATVSAQFTDVAGNASAWSTTLTVTFDRTAPTLTVSTLSATYGITQTIPAKSNELGRLYVAQVNVWTWSDLMALPANQRAFNTETVVNTNINIPLTTMADCGYCAVYATDNAGNISAASSTFSIDATSPTVTYVDGISGSFKATSTVTIKVHFSENVVVTGTPRVYTSVGLYATYASGTGTDTLTFTLTVPSAVNSADLNYNATSSLDLGSGGTATIKDAVANSAVLTLPALTAAESLASQSDIIIDTTAPTVTWATPSPQFTNGSSMDFAITMSEQITGLSPVSFSNTGTATGCNFIYTDMADGIHFTLNVYNCGTGTVIPKLAASGVSDLAGNANAASTSTTTATIDRTAPVVSACTCGKVSGVQNTGTAVTADSTGWIYFVSSTITVTDVASITSQADNLWNAQSVVASTSTNILGSGLLEGTYKVYAVDLAGNLSATWASGTVTVDNVAPTFSVVGGTYGNGNVVKTTSSEIGVVWFVHNSVVPPSTVTAAWLSTATGWTDKRLTANIAAANTATNSQSFCTNPPCSQTSGVYNAYAVDSAGNVSAVLTSVFTLDVTSPTVVSVSSSSPNGKYLYGQTINIDVTFSEPMSSTATAFVSIETGAVDRTAYYSSGNGTSTLTFLYTVQAGDVSSDLDLVNGTVWKGNGLSDVYGNASQGVGGNFTGLPVGSSTVGSISYAKDIQVDGIVPTVTAVNSASGAGPFTSTFTFSQDVTDFDIADLTFGGTATGCSKSLSATSASVYVLTYTGCSNGTITATVRVDAALLPSGNTGPKSAYTTATITSDTTPPTITPSASVFYFNATTPTNFTSNEVATVYLVNTSVTVTDVASITSAATNLRTSYNWTTGTTSVTGAGLIDGAYKFYGVDAYGNMSAASTNTYYLDTVAPTPTLSAASYKIGGSASAQSNELGTLYLVKSTVTVTNLASITGASASNKVSSSVVAVDTNQSIALTGLLDGTYYAYAVDRANNLSLVSTNSITLDNTAPTITNVTGASADGNYKIGQTVLVDVLFSEVVNVNTTGGTPTLLLETGTTDRNSTYLSGSGTTTLRFTYTVQTGDITTDLNYQSTTALALNSGVIADAAGNNATLTLPALANAASLASRSGINVKGTIMTVSSGTPPTTPTNVTNLSYSITFSETVYGLDASDFAISGTATGCAIGTLTINAAVATVPVTGCSDGTVILKLTASTVADFAGNAAPTADYTFATITVDRTAPTVTLTGPTSPTNATSIVFTATFSETISGLAIGDFTRTGTATGCSAGTVSAATGISATVTFTGCSEGTIILTQSANSVLDATSNTGPTASVTSATITIDRTKPSVSSFVPPATYSNAASPVFVLTINESVTGLTSADFTYTGTATGCTFTPDASAGTVFNVTASGCSQGTVTPTLVINGVSDLATNTGPAAAYVGNALTIDRTTPTASAAPAVVAGSDTGISSTDGKTNLTSVSVGATTSEATGTLTITATLGATTYTCQTTVVASSGSCSFTGLTEGTWSISTVFTDLAGNDSVSSTVSTFTIDTTAPTVTIASPSSPIYSLPTTYTFTFSESITGFTSADLSNNSGTATGCVFTPASSSGTVINVSVSSCTDGSIDLKLAASSVADVAGNTGPASDEIATMATIDNGPPVVSIVSASLKNTASATVQTTKPATVYVVKSTVTVSTASDITSAADNNWNSVSISALNTDTALALTGLVDGTYRAYGVDAQSRISLASTNSITVDNTAPVAPVSVALLAASDTGTSNSDGITKNNAPTVKVVAAEAGGTITVTATKSGETNVVCSMSGSTSGSTCDLTTLVDGTWSISATQTDTATNVSSSSSATIVIDTVAPTVSNVTSNAVNGAKKVGVAINVQVVFDSTVRVDSTGGTPSILMETGATDRAAPYASTLTTVVNFTYTVQTGDTSSDLDYASANAISLNGGAITDIAGNAATTTLPTPGSTGSLSDAKALVIDTTAPNAPVSVALYSLSDSGNSNSDGITNDNTPTIKVVASEVGGTVTVTASKTGQTSVTCSMTGSAIGSTCDLGTLIDGTWTLAATQTDAATNVSTAASGSLQIDTVAAAISGVSSNTANGANKAGANIDVRVTFDSAIWVDTTNGSPKITLETGVTDRDATYNSTSTPVITFNYMVQAGDTSADLDYVSTSAFALNGAVITDVAGNITTTPTLPTPGTAGSLGDAKALVIDTTAPSAPATVTLDSSSDSGSSNSDGITNDTTPTIKVIAAEAAGTVTVTATKVAQADVVCTVAGSTTGSTCDLGTLAEGIWTLSATQTDAAGNVSSSVTGSLTIDTTAAAITSVSSNDANGSYKAGAVVGVRVTFDSAIFMNTTGGSPTLTMETGTTDRDAAYTATSSPVVLFDYTVQAGDTSADLDYTSTTALVLHGAVITDIAGNITTTPTLPTPGATGSLGNAKALVIDTTAPSTPTSVVLATSSDSGSSNSDGITNDNTPTIKVVAAEAGGTVTVTAAKNGQTDVICTMSGSTSGSTCDLGTLVDGTWTLTASQTDTAGNVSSNASGSVQIDTVAAAISSVSSNTANGSKKAGATVDVRVTFDSAISIDTTGGSPTLLMETGATDRTAPYTSTSTPVVVFTYTVQAGDTSADLDYVATNSFSLNSAVITDVAGNITTAPTLPTPGAAGSLANAKAIVIDTAAPNAPVSVALATSSDSGSSNSDGITNDNTPTIKVVTAEAGGTVTVTATKSGQTDVTCTMSGSITGSTCDLGTLVDGTWTLTATQTDLATNVSTSASGSLEIDTVAAAISSVSSNDANGSYKAGAVVGVRVTFDSAIFMNTTGGSPTLTMETGTTDRDAAYTATSSPSVLFDYTVQAGDTSSDLDYTSTTALALHGAVITDVAGNITTTPTLPTPGATGSLGNAKALVIDTTAPNAPISVALDSTSDSGTSNSDGITNDNTPTIKVVAAEANGTITVTASKAGQTSVTCSMNASTTGSTCDLGTLIDGTWTLVATHTDVAGNVSSNASVSVQIDTVAAAISSVSSNTVNGSKKAGVNIDVRVTFDSAITMNITGGSPKLTLETGATDRDATYNSTSSPVVIFNYTVQAGDTSSDLDYASTTAFTLNGAVITDVAGNITTTPTLPIPGVTGSLANAKAIVIDTAAPSAPVSVALDTASDSGVSNADAITNDNTPTIRVVASENGGTVTVSASKSGQSDVTCTAVGSTTGSTCDLSAIVDGSWTLAAIQSDAAGNDSGSVAGSFTIDTVAAAVTSVSSNTANGPKKAGAAIDVRVTFDSGINVNISGGSPTVLMETGATDRAAVYTSTASPVMVFTYTVQAGDTSSDLDYVATNSFALNGAIITDVAGNASTPVLPTPGATGSLANAKAIVIDTTAPNAPTLTTATMKNTANATVQADEITTAYLVKSTVTISSLSSITSAADNVWNQVSITSINTATSLAATGLIDGTYRAYVADDAGNVSAASTNSVTIDTTAPVVTISASPSSVTSGGTSTITFTISETTTGFTASDVTVGLGVLTNFTGSGTSYTATFTASSVAGGSAAISIADSAFIDAAGNSNALTQSTISVASPVGTNGRGTTNNSGTDYIIEQFSTAGNYPWTVPNGVTSVEYIVIGGGGGGAGGGYVAAGNGGGGGGGASGVYRTGTTTVTPGDSLTISVGNGGSAGAGGSSSTPAVTQGTTGGTGAQSNAFGVSADGGFGGCASELNASVSSCGYLTKSTGFGGYGGHNIDFNGGVRASVTGGGGSGGAGSFGAGGNTSSSTAGVGGSGTTTAFFGGSDILASGGNGGAGASGAIAGAAGTSRGNGGGGGAGGLNGSAGGGGGAGADGFVAVRYAVPAVTTPDMTAESDTGVSNSDNLTKLTTPTFTGTAVVGASVQLYVDSIASGSPCIANISTGIYTCTTGTLSHGSHSVYAKSTVVLSDGSTQATSLSLTFNVDTVLPIPTLTSGTLQWGENATVRSNEVGTAYLVAHAVTVYGLQDILNANGSWWNSVSIPAINTDTTMSTSGLVSDTYQLYVADAAGNLSDPSAVAITYVDDTTAPTASVTVARVKSPNNAALRSTELGTLYLVRTAVVVHSVLDITRSSNNSWASASVVSPNTDVNISVAGLLEGEYVAYAVDRAGNFSAASSDQIVVDNTAPDVTNITSVQNSYAVRNFGAHVAFNEAVVGLTGSDFSNTGTATSCVFNVHSGTNYVDYSFDVTCGGDGTVVITLNANSVTDVAGNIGPATSYTSVPINLGANPTKLVLSTPSVGTASGAAFTTQPAITLKNAQDLVVLSYAGTITAAITQVNGTGSLVGTTTATVDTSTGIATFTNLGITGTAGTQYTITYSLGGLTTASQDITVTVGAATKLLMSTQPVGGASGAQLSTQPVVRISDSGNNTVIAGSYSVSVSASTGTIGGTRPKISSNGLATFTDLTFSGLASQSHTLTFTSSGLTQVVSASFNVTAGAPTQLVLTTQSIGTESGAAFTTQPVLEVRDSGGNKVSSSTASVTASVSTGATLEGTLTFAAVNGVVSYTNLGISGTAGTQYTITYSSAGLSSAVQAVTPTVGPASRLSISTQPVGAGAGAQLSTQPVVQVVDTGGNVITGSNASIAVTVSAGTLGGTTSVTAVSGVGTFTNLVVTSTTGSAYRLTFTSLGLTSAISDTFTVSVGVATHLAITTQPVGAGAGQILATQPVVKVLDAGDNVVTGSSASISATASGGWLSGTTTKSAVNGVASFSNVVFAGTINTDYTLSFAATGLGTVQSNTFRVTVGPSSQLVITTSAAGAKYKQAFSTQPIVEVQDSGGNRTSSNVAITATLSTGTVLDASGASMTVNASNGVATFTGLGMIATPSTYSISYSAPSLLSANQSISLAKGDQSVTFAAPADRVFNVAAFTLSPTTSSGLTVQLASTTTSVCTVTGTSVTMMSIGTCSLTASQAGNTNYNAASDVVQSFVITRATPQVTFNTLANKTYGDAAFTISASADNPVAVSFAGTAGICSVGTSTLTSSTSTATVTIVGAGTCTITASRAQDATYEVAVAASGSALTRSFTIAKATGTITYNQSTLSQTYDGTSRTVTATTNSGTLTITYTGIAPTVYAPSTTAPTNAGSYAVVAVQNDGNYQSTLPATLVVDKAVGTITLDSTTFAQTYSGTSRSVLVQSTSPANLNTVLTYTGTNSTTYGPSVFAPTNAGTYSVTAVLNDTNYQGSATGGLAVALGTQSTITFINGTSTTYNRPMNLLAVGGTGTGAMTYATTSGPCTVDATTGTMTPTSSGVCVVVATRAGSGNFAATSSAPYSITIDKAAQSVDFTSTVLARPLPGNTYTPTAVSSSGLPVAISITQGNGSVCTMTGGVVTIVTSGTCEVSAAQAGDNSWLAAPTAIQTMVAGRLNQNISFASIATKTFGDPVFSLGATSSSGLIVEYAVVSGAPSCSVAAGGIVTLGVIGTCVVEATQPGDAVYSAATAVRRSITVIPTVPSSPFLSSVSTNDGSVTVAYSAPSFDGGLPVQAYSVAVRYSGTDRSFDVTKTDCTTSMSCYIDGLTNGLTYSVTVTAKNAVGESAPSLASPLVLPILNPQAVRGLTARAGDQTIDVSWSAPSSLGGGTFTRYEIAIRDRSGTYQTPIVINNYNATSYQFTGLNNGTSYDVKVVTFTSYNSTEYTGNTAEVFEMPRTVPTAPRDLTIAAPTGRLARVSWRIPQSDGGSVITSYVVNAQAYTCVLATPTDVVCEISGLTPGSPLSVEVRAVNGVGQSLAASAGINLPNRPAAPSVQSVVVTDTSAVVTWLPPVTDGGQPLLGYLVYVTETGSRVSTSQIQANVAQCSTLQTTCQIDGLDATKKYTFTVRAVNAVGTSDASAPFDPFAVKISNTPKTPTPVKPAPKKPGIVSINLPVDSTYAPASQSAKITGAQLKANSTATVTLIALVNGEMKQKTLVTRTIGASGTLSLTANFSSTLPPGTYQMTITAVGANGVSVTTSARFAIAANWSQVVEKLPTMPPANSGNTSTNVPGGSTSNTIPVIGWPTLEPTTTTTVPSSGTGGTGSTVPVSATTVPGSVSTSTTVAPKDDGTIDVTLETTHRIPLTLKNAVTVFGGGFSLLFLWWLLVLLLRRRREDDDK